MNSLWPVLQTYLWRPRFWVITLSYVLVVWCMLYWFSQLPVDLKRLEQHRIGQAIVSAIFACIAGCFFALHVRRQFTNEMAHTTPGYAAPHLLIAGFITVWLCVLTPGIAIVAGHWPVGALALHAAAAILMAVVTGWPKGLALLLAIPVLAVWSDRIRPRDREPLIYELVRGDRPWLAMTILALAAVAAVAAAYHLLRLPRMGLTTNDELSVDPLAAANDTNPFSRWILASRDTAAARHMDAHLASGVQRWRVPVAISFTQLALPAIFVAIATLIGWIAGDASAWAILSTAIVCAVLLLVPLGSVQARRHTMGVELLRPVSRELYFRQILAAMGWDVAAWIGVATLLIVVVAVADFLLRTPAWGNFWQRGPSGEYVLYAYLQSTAGCILVLWGLAVFVFGLGVALLRWPFWLPIVAVTTMVWSFGGLLGIGVFLATIRHIGRVSDSTVFISYSLFTALVGLILVRSTYTRWIRSDVA